MQTHTDNCARQPAHAGFTLIELLVVMAILSILCGLSLSGYHEYYKRAQFAAAVVTLRNAQIALEAGQEYLGRSRAVSFTAQTDDGPLTEDQRDALPGLVVKPGIRVRLFSTTCGVGSKRMEMLAVLACDAGFYTWWMKTCQGYETSWPKSPIPRGMCS